MRADAYEYIGTWCYVARVRMFTVCV
jgi:hypothetical protein